MQGAWRRLRRRLKRTCLYGWYRRYLLWKEYRVWRCGGTSSTPHLVKQRVVREYARRSGVRVLVETGTYRGDMVAAMRHRFSHIYSIELDAALYADAQRRFARQRHVTILHGDSGAVLGSLLAEIAEPCLFWLDGHYSEGVTARGEHNTPIRQELEAISRHAFLAQDVILIDDARCFIGQDDYPRLVEVQAWAAARGLGICDVQDDIIRIHRRDLPAAGGRMVSKR